MWVYSVYVFARTLPKDIRLYIQTFEQNPISTTVVQCVHKKAVVGYRTEMLRKYILRRALEQSCYLTRHADIYAFMEEINTCNMVKYINIKCKKIKNSRMDTYAILRCFQSRYGNGQMFHIIARPFRPSLLHTQHRLSDYDDGNYAHRTLASYTEDIIARV